MPLSDGYISQAYEVLASLAGRHGQPICYSQLTRQIGITARAAGGVLKPISKRSYEERGVLLSVLAVGKRSGIPSKAFFEQARELGAMPSNMLPQIFFRNEIRRVYEAYQPDTSKLKNGSSAKEEER